ncbi:MAG TPA: fluoride efflux transporter CrcB [Cyclobacteriaceae bacterium]|nr:fluoride efflux transporter CrcB [Cyclobacteriaceae bacterium]
MKTAVIVFLGGGLGSVLRYSIGKWVGTLHTHIFPFGTLAANVLACFALGILVGLADQKQLLSPSARLFWSVGFCGGFSTFSTFSLETISLIQGGFNGFSAAYVIVSVALCLAATFAGMLLTQAA